MLRVVLALLVVALVAVIALRTVRTAGRSLSPAGAGASAASPRQTVDDAARAVGQALQQGAAATAERASEAGN